MPTSFPLRTTAVLLALALLTGYLLHSASSTTESGRSLRSVEIIRSRPDTVRTVVAVRVAAIRVHAKPNKVLWADSTRLYCLDTVIRADSNTMDTLSICHLLPADSFRIVAHFAARHVAVTVPYLAHDTIIHDERERLMGSSRTWYDDALLEIAAVLAGFLVGRTVK